MRQEVCDAQSGLTASRRLALRPVNAMGPTILVLAIVLSIVSSPAANAAQAKEPARASASTSGDAAQAAVGNADRGKELFVTNGCFACHGYEGQGGSYTGPKIAPDPLPWQAIAAFIRNPRGLIPPYITWPFNVMPPFTSRMVPDKDVQDIYAYLKTVPGPADIKSIPTFKK
jgi:mono/diheme cytochrome c family protein